MDVVARIEQLCRSGPGERQLRVGVLAELRTTVPFDAYAWLLTDPTSCVGWSPVAEIPDIADLPEVIHAKYLTATNRWTGLRAGSVATMAAIGPDRRVGPLWSLVESRYAISDIASVVLRDKGACWGFVDLWRRGGIFEPAECELLAAVAKVVTPTLRSALLPTFATVGTVAPDGPVVLLVGDDLRPRAQTGPTGAYLDALLPAGAGGTAVPAAGLNVAAQLCAREAAVDDGAPEARIYVPDRSWMTIRGGRINPAGTRGATIAITIEPTPPTQRASLYATVAALTDRETSVFDAIVAGNDTRHAAHRLGITDNTVQDHLKAIFTKTNTDSRRQLISRAIGSSR